MRLDLSDLYLFICIVDAGSISRGASKANLALASASERLRNIEADAGVELLKRLPRGVIATDAGEALAVHARMMLSRQALMKEELQEYASGRRGNISLYANTAAMNHFIPTLLGPWLAERPLLNIKLKECTSIDIVRGVAEGFIEAGIISDAVDTQGLILQPAVRDYLVLIVPPRHRLANAGETHFPMLFKESFIGLTPGSALQEHIFEQARIAGMEISLRISMRTFEGVCGMVGQGAGLGIVPESIASRYMHYHYRVVELRDAWARRNLCFCYSNWEKICLPLQNLLTHLGAKKPPAKAE